MRVVWSRHTHAWELPRPHMASLRAANVHRKTRLPIYLPRGPKLLYEGPWSVLSPPLARATRKKIFRVVWSRHTAAWVLFTSRTAGSWEGHVHEIARLPIYLPRGPKPQYELP